MKALRDREKKLSVSAPQQDFFVRWLSPVKFIWMLMLDSFCDKSQWTPRRGEMAACCSVVRQAFQQTLCWILPLFQQEFCSRIFIFPIQHSLEGWTFTGRLMRKKDCFGETSTNVFMEGSCLVLAKPQDFSTIKHLSIHLIVSRRDTLCELWAETSCDWTGTAVKQVGAHCYTSDEMIKSLLSRGRSEGVASDNEHQHNLG